VCFLSLLSHTGLRAQSAPGFPCALDIKRATMRLQSSGEMSRENADVCFQSSGALRSIELWNLEVS